MAERVQRFLWDNLILASTTVLSALSSTAGLPVAHLRDPLQSKRWRSAVGWTVAAGFNNKIDFTEAGVARVGTITASTYSTGATMATAIQAAMNAAPGAVNTYTVTYDAGTHKFTIARATGAAAVVLKFAAGAANYASSVHPDLGYSNADKSGDTSYLADLAVHQSRQALYADLGASSIFSVCALNGTPLSGTRWIEGDSTTLVGVGGLATPAFSQVLGSPSSRQYAFASGAQRHFRLLIDDRFNTNGYTEVGIWFLGEYLQLSRAFIQGNTRQAEMLTETLRGDQGAIYRNPKNAPKRHSVQFRSLTKTDRDNWQEMEDASIGQHIFFFLDALNSPLLPEIVYGVIEGPADIPQSIRDGTPPDGFAIAFSFLEDLG